MSEILNAQLLKSYLEPLIKTCSLWEKKRLTAIIIANPRAGGFTLKRLAKEKIPILYGFKEEALSKKDAVSSLEMLVWETTYAGHAGEYAQSVVNLAKDAGKNEEFLVITAGGDGTSLEVQTVLLKNAFLDEKTKKIVTQKIAVLRLPFGTGNDGSDGRSLDDTLTRLVKPSHFVWQRAVKVMYEGKVTKDEIEKDGKKITEYGSLDSEPPWYSFNLASVGIDAFITHMTNKTKGILPGNFYQLWVNLAAVFYGLRFPQRPMFVEVLDEKGNEIRTIDSSLEFCLLGVSGHRTYGSNHKILPTDDTFCATIKMSLFQKLKYLKSFETGDHINCPLSFFNKAHKIRIAYNEYILVQMDGEVHLLHPKQFPLTMERTEPVIKIIECDDAPYYKGAEKIL
ncbi:MAG TPA: diacylglycerol kinase family protein [Treponemataceae bacterium]|jgi:diacylglycerol kinase family enzyme|nr:diacylglycerol kinase family protein [Treponemataceae bacterium]HQL05203.1 diacylglycerol kinase family protein [Treponemataceae bacterium]